jgi:hypothetical protein
LLLWGDILYIFLFFLSLHRLGSVCPDGSRTCVNPNLDLDYFLHEEQLSVC